MSDIEMPPLRNDTVQNTILDTLRLLNDTLHIADDNIRVAQNIQGRHQLSQYLFAAPPKADFDVNDYEIINAELAEDFKQKLDQYEVVAIAQAFESPTSFGKDMYFSPLYNFSRTPEGCLILLKTLDYKPEVARHLSGIALCNIIRRDNNMHYNTLFWLSYYAAGRQVLARLLQDNPALIAHIDPFALLVRNHHGKYADLSAFDLLAGTPDGRELLWQIVANNRLIRQKIHQHDLGRRWVYGIHKGTSPFYWLCSSQTGIKILNRLFTENPELRNVDKDTLYGRTEKGFLHGGATPNEVLQQSSAGQELRAMIVEQEDQVLKTLSGLGTIARDGFINSIGNFAGFATVLFFQSVKFPRCSKNMGFFAGKAVGLGQNVTDLAAAIDAGAKANTFSFKDRMVIALGLLLFVGGCGLVATLINRCSKQLEIDPDPVCAPLTQN